MSQSPNPTDSQALLQSMLQKLRLQPGREGQAHLHTPGAVTGASPWGQGGASSNLHKVTSSPGTNGIPSKEFRNPAADSNFSFRFGEIQQPGHGGEVNRGLTSFPSQKDNSVGDTGDNRVLGQATQPAITTAGTGQLFPTTSLKDASFERTDSERWSFGSSGVKRNMPTNTNAAPSMGLNENQDQGFKPKVYLWSLKSTDVFAGGQDTKVLNVGNGGIGALAENKDAQVVSDGQKPTNSSLKRQQRSPENKTRRWTQRIKERWRDRQGNFGKKGKEEGSTGEQKCERGSEISPPNQVITTESLISASNKDEERALASLDTSGSSKTLPAHTQDGTNDGHIRPASDFELGLGSFSLLEEITKGQEWAKFLSPNFLTSSANQRPSEEPMSQLKNQLNPHDSAESNGILNQPGGGSNQWNFRSTESSPATGFSMAQISPDSFPPANMNISGGKLQQADQSEPMEDGQNHSDMQSRERRQQIRPPSFVVPADNPLNPALKSRITLNRKRQHQRDERLQADKISDGQKADREGSMSSLNPTSSHMTVETGVSQHENLIPLYTLNAHPAPLSPPTLNPLARAPQGVLKYSISQESESSMETVNKRRRVEENRRVRFAEEVVAIESPDMDLDGSDLEEDSGADEDSVTEQECEVEKAAVEEEAPARRTALPAWILALKRKNTGRKRR